MDEQQMDRLSRGFARAVDRRTGVRGLLALGITALGITAVGSEESTAKTKTKGQKGRVTAQGPCGDGGAKANACTKDQQCCTGSCDRREGRCRCKQQGERCSQDRNCCSKAGQSLTCQSGTCQSLPVAAPTTQAVAPPPPPEAVT